MKRVIILLIVLIFLTGCGQENDGEPASNGSGEGLGAIGATLIWPEDASLKSALPGKRVLRATLPPSITTVTMTITGDGVVLKSRDFDATDGEGTISGVPIGVRSVTFDGKDGTGVTLYRGTKTDVLIQSEIPAVFTVEMILL